MIWAPSAVRSSGVRDFTVACVPTGMNVGVRMVPWGVSNRPARAPVSGSVASTVNRNEAVIGGGGSPGWQKGVDGSLARRAHDRPATVCIRLGYASDGHGTGLVSSSWVRRDRSPRIRACPALMMQPSPADPTPDQIGRCTGRPVVEPRIGGVPGKLLSRRPKVGPVSGPRLSPRCTV